MSISMIGAAGGGKVTVSGLTADVVKQGTTVTVKQGSKTVASVTGTLTWEDLLPEKVVGLNGGTINREILGGFTTHRGRLDSGGAYLYGYQGGDAFAFTKLVNGSLYKEIVITMGAVNYSVPSTPITVGLSSTSSPTELRWVISSQYKGTVLNGNTYRCAIASNHSGYVAVNCVDLQAYVSKVELVKR